MDGLRLENDKSVLSNTSGLGSTLLEVAECAAVACHLVREGATRRRR